MNKVRIPVEDWSTLRSNISVILERTSNDLFLAILKGIPNKMSVNLAQNMHALSCAHATYKIIVPIKIHGE